MNEPIGIPHLQRLLIDDHEQAGLAFNRNVPVMLKAVEFTNAVGSKSVGHVLINRFARVIGHPDTAMPTEKDGITVMVQRSWDYGHSPEQVLTVNSFARNRLLERHPSTWAAIDRANDRWDTFDNIGMVDIPLVFPHLLPKPAGEDGDSIESCSGMCGYLREFGTAVSTQAGELAYAAMLEQTLDVVAELVLLRNRIDPHCGNPFMQYMRRGLFE